MVNENNNNDHNHYVDYVKDHVNHAMEYGKNIVSTAHSANSELIKKVTDICAHNLSLGKSFLSCTNFDEIINWGEKFVKSNVDHLVESSSSIASKACSEITKANSEIAKKASKNFAEIKDKMNKFNE
ncbi:MAG: hypothetical protein WBJ81_02035 [Rickettsiales bacterium]